MKKIVPFKKDITLETKIAGINSISLEHSLKKQIGNVINGEFIISGTYKITPSSINLDNFEYKLPVNITVDDKYNIDDIAIDINDFYYEVINDQILSINIEVALDNLKEATVGQETAIDKEAMAVHREENLETNNESDFEQIEKAQETISDNLMALEQVENNSEVVQEDRVKSIFSGINDNDNYVVYKIHVVTENDTIESIVEEYQTDQESLKLYNDLANVKIGDKLIIANNEN